MRPVPNLPHKSKFDRIEIDVIGVGREIAFVANRVLPEPPLPDAAFAFARPARRDGLRRGPIVTLIDPGRYS